jgi:DNA modification methylase
VVDVSTRILVGDCRTRLRELPEQSVHTCVTSPPYFGLRDYGHGDQIGLEQTPDAFVAELVNVFREVKRVLRDDGTLWLNLGDSYATGGVLSTGRNDTERETPGGKGGSFRGGARVDTEQRDGLKPKDLIGIPWRVAFALQADGWYLRSDIIWHKPNPMPESVTDRPTKSHEYLFLLTKSQRYCYDSEAIQEDSTGGTKGAAASFKREDSKRGQHGIAPNSPVATHRPDREDVRYDGPKRNKRSVWTVATLPYSGAHFATFPPALIEPCILAGCPKDGTVLDPFGGAGTTGLVADRLGRNAILCELNPDYAAMAAERIKTDNPMFSTVEVL